ncbi:MAG: DNA cytosine methyltransferase [Alphaproteobacteria bacterium]
MRTESNEKIKTYKVLNLYAGIGGNRKLWPEYVNGRKVEVTAVEYDPLTAKVYKDFFPEDVVVIDDAHKYLLEHYQEFDFIWASTPCQSHSKLRYYLGVKGKTADAIYPDFTLYQEITFLKFHSPCDWVVENVVPYYKPLIPADFVIQRHCFWSNKFIFSTNFKSDGIRDSSIEELSQHHGFDLTGKKLKNKAQTLRNCVAPELGLYVFEKIINAK